jgi:hypothetical protein
MRACVDNNIIMMSSSLSYQALLPIVSPATKIPWHFCLIHLPSTLVDEQTIREERWNIEFDAATWKMFWREERWNIEFDAATRGRCFGGKRGGTLNSTQPRGRCFGGKRGGT